MNIITFGRETLVFSDKSRGGIVKDSTKEILSSIYQDNKLLMLELRKQLEENKRSTKDESLFDFFSNLHSSSLKSEMSSTEISHIEKKAMINNIKSQNEGLKRYSYNKV